MIDYKFKADVIAKGIDKDIKKVDRANYVMYRDGIMPSPYINNLYIDLVFKHGQKAIDEARKINQASYHRTSRLQNRIAKFLSMGTCKFLTLEFKQETLDHTSKETRRKYVSTFLKSVSDYYVANIDYGEKKGREHYHAVVVADYVNLDSWIYGFKSALTIHLPNSDVKLPKYINKLTNHAIKDTTRGNRCIYSRYK